MDLQGKRILITGGATGIGFALAYELLLSGSRVVLAGRRASALAIAVETLRELGGDLASVPADVTDLEDRASMLAFVEKRLGGLDILINNAGGVRAGRLEDVTEAEIQAMVEVNLVAPILLTRSALPMLRASGSGLVVNISSGIAKVGLPFYTTYAAVKAGIAHFGEALRRELDGEGVRVMTAFPGATATPMMRTSQAGPDLGFALEAPVEVARAIIDGIRVDALQVVRVNGTRASMIELNQKDPLALDGKLRVLKPKFEAAVRNHSTL